MKIFVVRKRSFIFVSLAIILIAILALILMRNLSREVFKEEVIYKGMKEDKIVALLCNVDWGNEYIPEMLKILDNNSIKITFSLTGRWANQNPDIVKEIYSHNHEIANHGYQHVDHDKLNYQENYDAISKAHSIIEELVGKSPKYFGPPAGAYNESTVKAARDLDYTVIMWSVDTIDWRDDSTTELIYDRVTKDIKPSDIVLMHPTENTVKALPEIIDFLFKNGYRIGTISDILN